MAELQRDVNWKSTSLCVSRKTDAFFSEAMGNAVSEEVPEAVENKKSDSNHEEVLNAKTEDEKAVMDPRELVASLKKGAKAGDGEAMWVLGICEEYGIGTKQNFEKAERLYEQSSNANNKTGKILSQKGGCGRGSGEMVLKSL